jgi:hypothetical protein
VVAVGARCFARGERAKPYHDPAVAVARADRAPPNPLATTSAATPEAAPGRLPVPDQRPPFILLQVHQLDDLLEWLAFQQVARQASSRQAVYDSSTRRARRWPEPEGDPLPRILDQDGPDGDVADGHDPDPQRQGRQLHRLPALAGCRPPQAAAPPDRHRGVRPGQVRITGPPRGAVPVGDGLRRAPGRIDRNWRGLPIDRERAPPRWQLARLGVPSGRAVEERWHAACSGQESTGRLRAGYVQSTTRVVSAHRRHVQDAIGRGSRSPLTVRQSVLAKRPIRRCHPP